MVDVGNVNKKRKRNPQDMGFWEHLEELRWHLVRSLIAIALGTVFAFMKRDFIFDTILLGPKTNDFLTIRLLCNLGEKFGINALCLDNSQLTLINITMSGQFTQHIYISLVAGLIIASPYVFYELWRFIKPALREEELRYSSIAITIVSILFIIGILFSYFLIVPLTINFLGNYQVSEMVKNQISLSSYINTVVGVILSVGIVFELPALAWVLSRLGIITDKWMRKYRKVMIIVIFIVAAIITPPDMFSQILVAVPLLILYEISIYVAAVATKKREQN
ncbi:MAG: twin-arginine translocase subunit TatC [Lentimicrobium sp.]